MKLELKRFYEGKKYTLGLLCIDGLFECFTLEDTARHGAPKIPGETAIPEGTYPVTIDESARFKRLMPHVMDVPGFSGIRIHSGNTADDTEGCILLGDTCNQLSAEQGSIGNSRIAFAAFFTKLQDGLANKGEVLITIHTT
jgi:hypothetical protein